MVTAILIITCFALAILHYYYESLIAPLLRSTLYEELLILRRRVRDSFPAAVDDPAVEIVKNKINHAIDRMNSLNIVAFYYARKLLRSDSEVAKLVTARRNMIERSAMPELIDIDKCLDRYLLRAIVINSGGFFFWTWPYFLVTYLLNRIRKVDAGWITPSVRSIFSIPGLAMR